MYAAPGKRLARNPSQGEIEGRTLSNFTFCPYTTAVPADDALHGSQPDACTRKIAHAMQSLKRSKELIRVGHVKACPIIVYEKGLGSVRKHPCAELDLRRIALGGKLPGITKQVLHDDPQQARIPLRRQLR